jgi:hypothetical protein
MKVWSYRVRSVVDKDAYEMGSSGSGISFEDTMREVNSRAAEDLQTAKDNGDEDKLTINITISRREI